MPRLLWTCCFVHSNNHGRCRNCFILQLRRNQTAEPNPVYVEPGSRAGGCVPSSNRSLSFRTLPKPAIPGSGSNYELFNRNNISECYWSWNYRGCWPYSYRAFVCLCAFGTAHITQVQPDHLLSGATPPTIACRSTLSSGIGLYLTLSRTRLQSLNVLPVLLYRRASLRIVSITSVFTIHTQLRVLLTYCVATVPR